MPRRFPIGVVVLIVVVVVAMAFPALIGLVADWYWFRAVGFQVVFTTELLTKLALGLGSGVFAFLFLYANLRFAQRGVVPKPVVFSLDRTETRQLDLTRLFRRLSWPAALLLAFLIGTSASGAWLSVLTFLHRTPFHVADPIFQRDVSFYVFTVPVLTLVLGVLYGVAILSLLLVVPLYVLRNDVILRRRPSIEPSAQLHLGVLLALLFAVTALNTFLVRIPGMLYTQGGSHIFGATYADLHARLPLLRVAAVC